MKMTLFRSKSRELDDRLQALRYEREECMTRIRGLRAEMEALVQKALDVDDLDQKILSLDYTAVKGKLNAEGERFQDLSRMIARIQEIQAVNDRGRRLKYIASMRDGFDENALRREEDEIEARRAMLEEEEDLGGDGCAFLRRDEPVFTPDADFACQLARARRNRQAEAAPTRPAEAVSAG